MQLLTDLWEIAMKVSEIMTADLKSCRPDTPLAGVAAMMAESDLRLLPVVDDGHRLHGAIQQRDVCRTLARFLGMLSGMRASDVMHAGLVCDPEDDVRTALKLMNERQVEELTVVDRLGVVQGVLSMTDIILHASHESPRNLLSDSEVMRVLKAICSRRSSRRHAAAM